MPLTESQRTILHHVGYEWWMFRSTHDLLLRIDEEGGKFAGDPVRNAILESLAIHGRALVFFFCHEKKMTSDWVVSDLGLSFKTNRKSEVLQNWLTDSNQRIAHLTALRTHSLRQWNVPVVRAELQALFDDLRMKIGADLPPRPEWLGDAPTESRLLNLPVRLREEFIRWHHTSGSTASAAEPVLADFQIREWPVVAEPPKR